MKKRTCIMIVTFLFLAFIVTSVQAQTIKIGSIFPFTGQMAVYAEDAKRALDFALEEVNNAGGINGKKVEFIYEDSTGTPKGGVAAAQKLIEINNVDALIGCLFSSVVMAVKPVVTANKTVLVAPMASDPDVYAGTRYIFSLTPTDNDNCFVNAKYCTQVLKKKTLGILYMLNDSGISSDRYMTQWWEHFGGKVLAHEDFTPGSMDFRTQLTKIRDAGPDTVFIHVTWREAVNVLKQIWEMNMKVHVTANSQVNEPKILEMAGEAAEGLTFTTAYVGDRPEDKRVKEEYEKAFTAKYKQAPAIVGWNTYDCARVLFEAMKRGGTRGDSLRNEMVKLNIPGVFGRIRFRDNGSPIKDTEMYAVKEGKFVKLNFVDHAP
jgi:branched-chain amino acid transport system substrate-binding protein